MQIFFIAPQGYMQVRKALQGVPGQRTHGWSDEGSTQIVGVAEVTGDSEQVALALESVGCLLFPDHRFNGPISKDVADALSDYGVSTSDSTATAMVKVQAKSGFPPHKHRRYA